ncbi:YHS domain-containing (seleno)protein [Moritella viscosa]|uniref:YHS domain protein n=1 Tax=Moritella viscosa TaxID=80854 RepID=A0A090IGP8_9GAMM|nr:YHS domain-containing (seleno)protein [Moritella viscosa]CED59029.1 putative exported YHS domain protein [Moritella viscosa]SGY84862.1 YHS domain protein [Moritella viscosa]SGY86042.1 YHS domain protein [Moritella viscosa]SGZ07974.1 YHS domain protein [Moritella viscosa]SGZ17568.1 YHS domain protein [Moritella viscosa]
MKYIIKLLVISSLIFSFNSFAKDPIYTGYFSSKAVSGYDTVAYFTQSKAVKGLKKFTYEYKGEDWYFSNSQHLALFKQEPTKYAPQYGGYCAYAVANNGTASTDPTQWTIVNGKLYLNYNADIRQQWLKDKLNFIVKADQNWPHVLN